jgi:hypothetical protein
VVEAPPHGGVGTCADAAGADTGATTPANCEASAGTCVDADGTDTGATTAATCDPAVGENFTSTAVFTSTGVIVAEYTPPVLIDRMGMRVTGPGGLNVTAQFYAASDETQYLYAWQSDPKLKLAANQQLVQGLNRFGCGPGLRGKDLITQRLIQLLIQLSV